MAVVNIVQFIAGAAAGLGIGNALVTAWDLWNDRRKGTRHA